MDTIVAAGSDITRIVGRTPGLGHAGALDHNGQHNDRNDIGQHLQELIRNNRKFSFDLYKELIANYRKIVHELDMALVAEYAYELPKSSTVMETLRLEIL